MFLLQISSYISSKRSQTIVKMYQGAPIVIQIFYNRNQTPNANNFFQHNFKNFLEHGSVRWNSGSGKGKAFCKILQISR